MPACGTAIVLVHGTFARNAPWTRPTSTLYRGLLEQIPGEKSVSAFSWSGRNSPAARFQASERLRSELHRATAQFPGWKIVVIGHSHGGTVALRAVDCEELRDRVRVVCLSTPFLQAFPRDLPAGVPLQLAFAISFWIALAVYFAAPSSYTLGIGQFLFASGVPDEIASRTNGLIFILAVLGIGGAIFALLSRLEKAALRAAGYMTHTPSLAPANVLLLRVAGDEASSWISLFQVLSWVSSKLSRLYAGAISKTVRMVIALECLLRPDDEGILFFLDWLILSRPMVVGILAGLSLAAAFEPSSGRDLLPIFEPFWGYIIRGFLACLGTVLGLIFLGEMCENEILVGGLYFPLLLLIVPVSACYAVLGILAFGSGTAILALFYELSVESSPLGSGWRVILLSPMRTGLVYHSQVYENPEALVSLCSWIGGARSRAQQGSRN